MATALATRAAHQLFDTLMWTKIGAVLADANPKYYASVVRALLVHQTSWNEVVSELEDIFGPFLWFIRVVLCNERSRGQLNIFLVATSLAYSDFLVFFSSPYVIIPFMVTRRGICFRIRL